MEEDTRAALRRAQGRPLRADVPQHLARRDARLGRPRRRRALVVRLRSGRGVPRARDATAATTRRSRSSSRSAPRSPSSSSPTPTRASSSTFPSGGGGYVVATKLLGPRFGVVSGAALLVDYVLTITISIASGGDAIFSMIPRAWFGKRRALVDADDIGTWLDPVQRTKVAHRVRGHRASSRSSTSAA